METDDSLAQLFDILSSECILLLIPRPQPPTTHQWPYNKNNNILSIRVPADKLTTVVKVSVENVDLFLNDHITSPRWPHQIKKRIWLIQEAPKSHSLFIYWSWERRKPESLAIDQLSHYHQVRPSLPSSRRKPVGQGGSFIFSLPFIFFFLFIISPLLHVGVLLFPLSMCGWIGYSRPSFNSQ